jgi:hypothetical protein
MRLVNVMMNNRISGACGGQKLRENHLAHSLVVSLNFFEEYERLGPM